MLYYFHKILQMLFLGAKISLLEPLNIRIKNQKAVTFLFLPPVWLLDLLSFNYYLQAQHFQLEGTKNSNYKCTLREMTIITRVMQKYTTQPQSSHLSQDTRDSTNYSLANDRERSIINRNNISQVLIPNNSNRRVEHVSNNCWWQATVKAKGTLFTNNAQAYSKCTSGVTRGKWLAMELEPGLDQIYGESCGLSHHSWQWC